MLQAERVDDYLRSKLPQASELTVENVFRIPSGASRETLSFWDASSFRERMARLRATGT